MKAARIASVPGFFPASNNDNVQPFSPIEQMMRAVAASFFGSCMGPFARGTLRIHSNDWTYTRLAPGHYRLERTELIEDGDVLRDLGSVYETHGTDDAMAMRRVSGREVRNVGFLSFKVSGGRLVRK